MSPKSYDPHSSTYRDWQYWQYYCENPNEGIPENSKLLTLKWGRSKVFYASMHLPRRLGHKKTFGVNKILL